VEWEEGRDRGRAHGAQGNHGDGNGVSPPHPIASFPHLAAQLRVSDQ